MSGRSLRSGSEKKAGLCETALSAAASSSSTSSSSTAEASEKMAPAAAVASSSSAAAVVAGIPVAGPSKKPAAGGRVTKKAGGVTKKTTTTGGGKAKKAPAAPTLSRQEKAQKRKEAAQKEAEAFMKALMSGKTLRDPQTERIGKEQPTKKAEQVLLQLKVSLSELEPKEARAWRRILVPGNMSFRELHVTIQKAFDWKEAHVYEFRIGIDSSRNRFRRNMAEPTVIGEIFPFKYIDDMEDACKKIVHEYMWKEGDVALYVYDLGDEWRHSIVVEKVLDQIPGENYPKVIDGKRRAPPEDCGSVGGFAMLLEALKKPVEDRSEDEIEQLEWLDQGYPGYDPNDFDHSKISYEGLFHF